MTQPMTPDRARRFEWCWLAVLVLFLVGTIVVELATSIEVPDFVFIFVITLCVARLGYWRGHAAGWTCSRRDLPKGIDR